MRIGILTFYKVNNFGANLQAISSYYAIKKLGHSPWLIDYQSEYTESQWNRIKAEEQGHCHEKFLSEIITEQTEICHNVDELWQIIEKYELEAVVIGSDAVLQHHPLIDRIKRGRRKPFYVQKYRPESMFPNLFWGYGFADKIKTVMLSVSCQNSEFHHFTKSIKKQMSLCLKNMKYISVRDTWTQDMLKSIDDDLNVEVTPDPVFAFNMNAGFLIPTKEVILKKYNLPDNYILVSLHSQVISKEKLVELKEAFSCHEMHCVALPMPTGHNFKHNFEFAIPTPLSPIDWYALIKYAKGYIGSNMHPMIVALHNAVPCYSIDHWGTTNFWGKKKKDGSSKVEHILGTYGLEDNRCEIENEKALIDINTICNKILNFPIEAVKNVSSQKYIQYTKMMDNIIDSIVK